MASAALARLCPSLRGIFSRPLLSASKFQLSDGVSSLLPCQITASQAVCRFRDQRPHQQSAAGFHTSACYFKGKTPAEAMDGPQKWPSYNTIVLPPQAPDEPRRPAQCFHYRTQIRYSVMKLWYHAQMIRGLSIDDAITQLSFLPTKGAKIVKEVLLEAQEMAVNEQNFEFKSNMYVAESFCGRGVTVKGYRRHGKGRFGMIVYNFHHYFVKLEEGPPPKDYYPSKPSVREQAEIHINRLRSRRIKSGL